MAVDESQAVRLRVTGEVVGLASLSLSGKAVNVWIDPFLYTSPVSWVLDVLEGRARKAAVFAGREVEGRWRELV